MSIFELDVRDLAANRDVKGLIDALNYEKADIRSTVADALPEIGTDAQIALPALIEALKDGDENVRNHVAEAIHTIAGQISVPSLIEALKDDESWIRQMAACTLGVLGPNAKAALYALIESLKDEDTSVRKRALEAIKKID